MYPLVAWSPTPGAVAPVGGHYASFPVPPAVRQAGRVGQFGSWLLGSADAIDRVLYGARVLVVALAAFVTVLASALEAWLPRGLVAKNWPQPDAPIITALSTFGFTSLLMTLFIARLGSLRDDDGQWSVELIQRRAHELRVDVGEVFSAFETMESALRWKAFGRVTLFAGFLVLASLHRFIRKRMPGSNPQRERPIGSRGEGTAGRADIIVAESVLIEMKRGVNTSTAQKAVGQIKMYMRGWSQGPIILLLCDAASENAERYLRREIEDLRAKGSSVVLVLAVRSGRAAR